MDAKETSLLTSVLVAIAFLAIVLTYFVIIILRHQRRSRRLYKSRLLAEITTMENERARIASDLHDELGPLLLSVKMNISSLDLSSEEDKEVVKKTEKNIELSIQRIKEISRDLMPVALLRKGLVVALEEFVNYIGNKTELRIQFKAEDIPPLTKEREVNVYRILQELIHNAIKHAKAKTLLISMHVEDGKLMIEAKDDGIGFEYVKEIKDNKGLGLRNLLSRTEILKGNMFLESESGAGTIYTFEIPI
jgi:two-component system, NarL family, sensor kinase